MKECSRTVDGFVLLGHRTNGISKNSAAILLISWYLKASIGTAIPRHQDNHSGCGLLRNRKCLFFQISDLIFQSLIDKCIGYSYQDFQASHNRPMPVADPGGGLRGL